MKATIPARMRSRMTGLILYGVALLLVLLAPVLGMMAAAVAAWHALVAGSIWYMPLGMIVLFAVIAMVQSHKPFDFSLLGLLVVAVIAWFRADALQQDRLLDAVQALSTQTRLMVGVLLAMILALVLVHATRRLGWPGMMRSRLLWAGLPVIMLVSIVAASDNVVGRL